MLTLAEIVAQLTADESTLGRLAASLTTAQRSYETATDRRYYSTEEAHAASFAEHLPAVQAVEAEVARGAGGIRARAREAIALTERQQPTLTDAEQAAAAMRREFVREDAETLPLDQLLERIQGVMLLDDRPGMYLYGRYARMRLGRGEGDGAPLDNRQGNAKGAIAAAVAEIDKRLRGGEVRAVYERALALLGKAGDLEAKAEKREREKRVYRFQSPLDVRW